MRGAPAAAASNRSSVLSGWISVCEYIFFVQPARSSEARWAQSNSLARGARPSHLHSARGPSVHGYIACPGRHCFAHRSAHGPPIGACCCLFSQCRQIPSPILMPWRSVGPGSFGPAWCSTGECRQRGVLERATSSGRSGKSWGLDRFSPRLRFGAFIVGAVKLPRWHCHRRIKLHQAELVGRGSSPGFRINRT